MAYTILGLKNPPYSSWRACGRSQWNKVIKGSMPTQNHGKKLNSPWTVETTITLICIHIKLTIWQELINDRIVEIDTFLVHSCTDSSI